MRRGLRLLTLIALVPLLGLLSAHAEPQTAFQLEGRIPASTLAFVSLEQIDTWTPRIESTALGKLMADPEMQAFMAPMQEMGMQLVEGGLGEMPPFAAEMIGKLEGLRGQVALALVSLDMESERPVMAASVDFGEHIEDFAAYLGRLREEVDPSAERFKEVDVNGRVWWSLDTGQFPIFATTVDTAIVVTTDRPLLVQILGGPVEGSLAGSESFLSVRRHVGGGDLGMFAYGNVATALEAFGEQMPARERHIAYGLGLDTVHAIGYGMAFKGDGFRDTLVISAPGADHGIIPLMEMKPLTAPRTLDLAPAGTFYWGEGNLPFDDLLARARTLVGGIDPDATEEMDEGLDSVSQMMGVDIEEEFLAGMKGGYGFYAAFPASGGLYPEIAMIFEVKDGANFEGVFGRMAEGIAGALNEGGDVVAATRTLAYRGIDMHLFEMQAARGNDVIPFTPTWAVLGDRLVITLVPYTMKEVILRAQGVSTTPGLAMQEDFQALMAQKPESAGGMEYVDLKGGLALLYDTLVPLLQTVAKPNVMEDFPLPLDWAQLPPASRVLPHFRSMGEFLTWNGDGITLSVQGPIPFVPIIAMTAAGASLFMATSGGSSDMGVEWEERTVMPPGDIEKEMDLELAKIQAEMLVETVAFFRLENDKLPVSLDDLVSDGLMSSVPDDPWGGAYRLVLKEGGGFVVESAGPDKQFGTSDDVRQEKE